MYEKIFGSYPQVKVLNYVLINPEKTYTKKEIAYGAQISRVTLDSFINSLIDLQIIVKEDSSYKVNINSDIVKVLIKTQITLAELVMKYELENSDNLEHQALSEEEFEKFMKNFDFDFDLDKELEKLEENEEILVNKKEYEKLKNRKINSSEIPNTHIINAFYPYNKNRMMINYG